MTPARGSGTRAVPAGPAEEKTIVKADELNNVGLNDWAVEELNRAAAAVGNSPKVNLAIARVYRSEEDNVRALNVLKKSFPDYSQMKPEELTREDSIESRQRLSVSSPAVRMGRHLSAAREPAPTHSTGLFTINPSFRPAKRTLGSFGRMDP